MARSAHRCHPAGVTDHFARGWVPGPARYQAGVFTVAQALAAGMSPDQVRRRRRTGEWVRLAGDALRPAATAQQPGSLAWAVALTWPDGVACLRTAAAMHRLPVALSTRAHAIVPTKRHPRPALVAHLVANGVEAKVHYPVPLHLQRPGRELGYGPGDMPVAEAQAERLVTLPAHEYLTDAQVARAVEVVAAFAGDPAAGRVRP